MNLLPKFAPGDAIAMLVVNVLVQVAVVVGLAWLLSAALGRHRPALRHAIWLSALGCVLLGPLAASSIQRAGLSLVSLRLWPRTTEAEIDVAPSAKVAGTLRVPSAGSRDDERRSVEPLKKTISNGTQSVPATSPYPNPIPTKLRSVPGEGTVVRGEHVDPLRLMLGAAAIVWALGVLCFFARLLHGWWSVARLKRQTETVAEDRLPAIIGEVRDALGVKKLPRLAVAPPSAALPGPITVGLLRPLVILPSKLLTALDARSLRDVLVHEFAHALRRDPLVGLLQRLTAMVYWPYPPVHFLNRHLAKAREEVCDNYVLRQGDGPGYAETLLTVSQAISTRHTRLAAVGLFHPRWRLEHRVAALLDERRNVMVRNSRTTLTFLAIVFAATMIAGGTALSQAEPAKPAKPAEPHAATAAKRQNEAPYRISGYDVLQIRVTGTLFGQPIDGGFLVEPDGRVALGPEYGRVNVGNLTPEEAERKITQHLKTILAQPDVQVTLARRSKTPPPNDKPFILQPLDVVQVQVTNTLLDQPIAGFYLIEPDGRVPLGPLYGRVDIKGLSVDQAQEAIVRHLKPTLAKPKVQVQLSRRGDKWRDAVFPRLPYTIAPGDVLNVRVAGTLLDQPIDGPLTVEHTGTLPLGPAYGRAQVSGLTLAEAEKAITKKLKEVLQQPEVQVTFPIPRPDSRETIPNIHFRETTPPNVGYTIEPGQILLINASGTFDYAPILGLRVVEPSGTVPLGPAYGRVQVRGLSLEAAEKAIAKKLKEILQHPAVQVTFGGWAGAPDFVLTMERRANEPPSRRARAR